MRQCFPPEWDQQYPDLIPGLKDIVVSTYKEGIPVRSPAPSPTLLGRATLTPSFPASQLAWNDLAQSADFVAKANELDRLLDEAKQRQAAGQPPRNAYEYVPAS